MKGKKVAVFGSMSPWYEAIAIAAGAAVVDTIEYNNLTYHHPQINNFAPRDLDPAVTGGNVGRSVIHNL